MRILGADLRDLDAIGGDGTLIALDAGGSVAATVRIPDSGSLVRETLRLAGDEPFLLAVDVPVAGPSVAGKPRRVDGWLQRRLGVRLPFAKGGATPLVSGSELLAALATAGHPCFPYPDRDRRRPGLAEIHPELVLKSLLWESSVAASARELADREAILRALATPDYRGPRVARSSTAERWAAVDLALRAAGAADGFDLRPARDELARAGSDAAVARAASLLDAALIAGTARRYLEEPERCAFIGERESGYAILPADAFVRRVALRESARTPDRAPLFPHATLEQRLAPHATVRPLELLDLPGRAPRVEAVFEAPPLYEFDNLDEMMWWKHCRHVSGPELPADGLEEIVVRLEAAAGGEPSTGLRLVRSRHKTLSFRFEPPQAWRPRVPPRDGKTYAFRVLRAVFER
jgi:hypothetical protein